MTNNILAFIGIAVIVVAMVTLAVRIDKDSANVSFGSFNTDVIEDFATNTSSTVNTTSTQVLAALSSRLYARITALGPTRVSCALDNDTAVASAIELDGGITIVPIGLTTSSATYFELGRCAVCIPYTGAVNCRALGVSRVGVVQN